MERVSSLGPKHWSCLPHEHSDHSSLNCFTTNNKLSELPTICYAVLVVWSEYRSCLPYDLLFYFAIRCLELQ